MQKGIAAHHRHLQQNLNKTPIRMFPKDSQSSLLKEHFGLHGSAPLVWERHCHLLFRFHLYIWEQEPKTLPTPPTVTIIWSQSFCPSKELSHTLLSSPYSAWKDNTFGILREHRSDLPVNAFCWLNTSLKKCMWGKTRKIPFSVLPFSFVRVNPFDVDFKSFWLDMKRTFHWRDIPWIPLILWLLNVAK